MLRFLVCVCSLVLFGGMAAADTIPMPQVDFEGDWHMEPGNGVNSARVHYSASLNAFRIDMATPAGDASVIRDMASGEMIMWGAMSQGMAMKLQSPNRIPSGDPTGETEEVNGVSCSIWQGPEVRVCLGEDNIPLSATARGTAVRLLNVQRASQAASLFQPPAGLQVMELPVGMMKQMQKMQGGMPGQNALPF